MMPSSDDVPVSSTPIRVELRSLLGKGSSVGALFGALATCSWWIMAVVDGIEDEMNEACMIC